MIRTTLYLVIFSALSLFTASCALATGALVEAAGQVAQREAAERIDRGVSAGADAAEEAILDSDDGTATPEDASASTPLVVGESFDFSRGERPLFYEDYSGDNPGDFPQGLELLEGTWDVVEIDGRRWLRGTGGRGSDFLVVLPETLPERFTIEYQVMYTHRNQVTVMATSALEVGPSGYEGTLVQVKGDASGVTMPAAGRELLSVVDSGGLLKPTPVQIIVDGAHLTVFVAGVRVADVPNAHVLRSGQLHFEDPYFSTPETPVFIGAIRVDADGGDLGRIERETPDGLQQNRRVELVRGR